VSPQVRRDRAEVFQGKDGLFYFRILAPNGEQIAASEGYSRKDDARGTIEKHYPFVQILELEVSDG
jgi:uncharacterized protein YegP (UPF0339 family)